MADLTEADKSYLDGLEREAAGYGTKIEIADVEGDEVATKRYTKRLAQVEAEAARVVSGGVTPDEDAPEAASGRGRGRGR